MRDLSMTTTTHRSRFRHGSATLTTVLCLLVIAPFTGACESSRSKSTVVHSRDLTLSAALEPKTGRAGENTIWLELEDREGAAVEDAQISVKVHMHAMGTMPAMGGMTSVTPLGSGRYRADFDLDMGGNWVIEIRAKAAAGQSLAADGSMTVGSPGLQLRSVGAEASRPDAASADMLDPVSPEDASAEISLDPRRLQKVGVRTGTAEEKPLDITVRTVARVAYDETGLRDVSLKIRGWVGKLEANAVGIRVERGSILFTMYSPELFSAQQEYLQALASQRAAKKTGSPHRADYLVRAASNRLRLWDISEADIERVARDGAAIEYLPVRSPTSGFVIEKNLVEGSAVEPGQRLFRIAPLDRVWLEAEVYEADFSLIEIGQKAVVTLPYLPGESYEGRVSFIYPYLASKTRTGRIRIQLPNPELDLRPDMYANVELLVPRGTRLVVPVSAVLFAGERRFVFRALGAGRFEPRPVVLGLRSGEDIEVLSGLSPGDKIVTSGTFLIASESRLQSAIEGW
jgi:membrane fusion protein, copper/silver efflux system